MAYLWFSNIAIAAMASAGYEHIKTLDLSHIRLALKHDSYSIYYLFAAARKD